MAGSTHDRYFLKQRRLKIKTILSTVLMLLLSLSAFASTYSGQITRLHSRLASQQGIVLVTVEVPEYVEVLSHFWLVPLTTAIFNNFI